MKNWKCIFEAQKGHPHYHEPNFNRTVEVVVSAKFKQEARKLADAELVLFDNQWFIKYRVPIIEQATDLERQNYLNKRERLVKSNAQLSDLSNESATSNDSNDVYQPAPDQQDASIRVYEFPICEPWAVRVGTASMQDNNREYYGYSVLILDRSNKDAPTIGNIAHMISISFETETAALLAGLRQAVNLMQQSNLLGHSQTDSMRIVKGYCTLTGGELADRYVTTISKLTEAEVEPPKNGQPEPPADEKAANDVQKTDNLDRGTGIQPEDETGVSKGSYLDTGDDKPNHTDQPPHADLDIKPSLTQDEEEKQIAALNDELNALQVGQTIIKDGLPNWLYHRCIGYSSTNLKEELISSQYRHNLETGEIEREPKHCFIFGNFIHTLLLQPELITKEYAFEQELPDGGYTTLESMKEAIRLYNEKTGDKVAVSGTKAELAARIREYINDKAVFKHELDEQWQAEVEQGKLPVSLDDAKRAQRIMRSMQTNPAIRNWYNIKRDGIICERSYFTKVLVDVDGQPVEMILKARLDKEIGQLIVDTKTIELRLDVKKEDALSYINKEIERRGYHLSAAHYLALTQKRSFFWIFHNKTLGCEWEIVIEAGNEHLQLGHFERNKALKSIARSMLTNQYLPSITQPLDINKKPIPLVSELSYYARKRLDHFIEQHIAEKEGVTHE